MNPLTKTFIVLVTLLAIVETAVVVPLLATQDKWKSMYQKSATSEQASRALLASKSAELAEVGKSGKDESTRLAQTVATLQESKSADSTTIEGLRSDLAKEEAERVKAEASVRLANGNLERVNRELADRTANYIEMVARYNDSVKSDTEHVQYIAKLQDELRRTINKLNEYQELTVATQQELAEAQAVVAGYEDKYKDKPAPSVASAQTVEGLVTGVRKAPNNVDLVSLNVGRRDLVKEGMEFTVMRGDTYIGKFLVTVVDTDECAGYLNHAAVGASVQEGDMAYIKGYSR